LTGISDYGSGTTLATTYANTQGTLTILGILTPMLQSLAPSVLAQAHQGLATVQADLLAQRAKDGHWTPVADLSTSAREKLDGDLGNLLETLSQVPGILTPRDGA
jgi:iron uptake system EfeUOB component EfeO/EfeM